MLRFVHDWGRGPATTPGVLTMRVSLIKHMAVNRMRGPSQHTVNKWGTFDEICSCRTHSHMFIYLQLSYTVPIHSNAVRQQATLDNGLCDDLYVGCPPTCDIVYVDRNGRESWHGLPPHFRDCACRLHSCSDSHTCQLCWAQGHRNQIQEHMSATAMSR